MWLSCFKSAQAFGNTEEKYSTRGVTAKSAAPLSSVPIGIVSAGLPVFFLVTGLPPRTNLHSQYVLQPKLHSIRNLRIK